MPAISTGELLRAETAKKSDLGLKAVRFVKRGQLVPDKLIHEMMAKRLKRNDVKKGFILDGYPRDQVQLDDLLGLVQDKYDIWVVNIDLSPKEVLNRLSGRRICTKCGASFHLLYKPSKKAGVCDVCGHKLTLRPDDKPEVVKERLKHYQATATPVLKFGKKNKKLVIIDGAQTIPKVHKDILAAVKKINVKLINK